MSSDELKAATILVYSRLDERQRRLCAGLESLRLGYGGDRKVADLLSMNVHTVAKGRKELLVEDLNLDRVRRPGGGRRLVKKTPQVIVEIEELMKYEAAGDPMTGTKWMKSTPQRIAEILNSRGFTISRNTVAALLVDMNFSLKSNRKTIATHSSPDRDQQFRIIRALRESFEATGNPTISVDTKKKELIGVFANSGRVWTREPIATNDHDFRSDATAIAVPYGLYDVLANTGTVVVGTSSDTPAFAVQSIATWWRHGVGA